MFYYFKLKKILFYLKNFFSNGQIGDGTSSTNRLFPVAVNNSGALSGKNIIQISVGETHTCAIANDSKAYCWGSNR
jgi:alpha-tubulin suppressor-like RCC1 family protein